MSHFDHPANYITNSQIIQIFFIRKIHPIMKKNIFFLQLICENIIRNVGQLIHSYQKWSYFVTHNDIFTYLFVYQHFVFQNDNNSLPRSYIATNLAVSILGSGSFRTFGVYSYIIYIIYLCIIYSYF